MIWYFNNKQAYDYFSQELIINPLTERFYKSVYGNSDEMELYYSLQYMKDNGIYNLSVLFPISDLSVNYGNAKDIDTEYCDKNNIHYRYENRSGGCMVLFPQNIIVQSVFLGSNFSKQYKFLHDFVEWLNTKEIKASTNGNDVLINDRKVLGAVSETLPEPYKGWIFFGIQISINSDPELINRICTKPMNKIPGALSDYGLTTEEVMNWTLEWFSANQ